MPATKNTPSTHHPRRRNVTTLMVGLKKRSHTQKSHPKVVNPRDIAGERKKKKKKKLLWLLPLFMTGRDSSHSLQGHSDLHPQGQTCVPGAAHRLEWLWRQMDVTPGPLLVIVSCDRERELWFEKSVFTADTRLERGQPAMPRGCNATGLF